MRRPSGDQAGSRSSMSLLVSRVISEPSAFIAYISWLPSRLDEKAMRRPSGDHAGQSSQASLSVSRIIPEPSAFAAYISRLPSRLDTKAILCPSGDQTCCRYRIGRTERDSLLASRVISEPSAFIAYISSSPSVPRREMNAMRRPSGRPGETPIVSVIMGKSGQIGSVGARRVYFQVAVSVGYESDAPSVRRPGETPIVSVMPGNSCYREHDNPCDEGKIRIDKPRRRTPIWVHGVYLTVAVWVGYERDAPVALPAASRRRQRREGYRHDDDGWRADFHSVPLRYLGCAIRPTPVSSPAALRVRTAAGGVSLACALTPRRRPRRRRPPCARLGVRRGLAAPCRRRLSAPCGRLSRRASSLPRPAR